MQSSMLHDMLPQYSAMNFTPSSKDGHTSPDTSLTSLNWLPDFKIADFQFSESSLLPPCSAAANTCSSISDDVFSSTTGSADSDREVEKEPELCPVIPLSPLKRCMNQAAEFDRNPWKYRENPKKPPFAYTALIYLAIRSTNKEKVMLGDIYQWIKDHFMYYRIAESTWQVSDQGWSVDVSFATFEIFHSIHGCTRNLSHTRDVYTTYHHFIVNIVITF